MDSTFNSLKKQFYTEVKNPTSQILYDLNNAEIIEENPKKIITINEQISKIETGVDNLKDSYRKGVTGTNNGYKTIIGSSIGLVISFILTSISWGLSEGSQKSDPKSAIHTLKWVFGGASIICSLIVTGASIMYGCKKVKKKRIQKEIETESFQLLMSELSEFVKAIDLLKNATEDIDSKLKNCMKKYDELDPSIKKQIPSKGKWIPLIIEQLPQEDELKTGLSLIKQSYENNENKEPEIKEKTFNLNEKISLNRESDDTEDENDIIFDEFYKSSILLNSINNLNNPLEKGNNNNWEKNFIKQNKPKHITSERGINLFNSDPSSSKENSLQSFWEILERRADTVIDDIYIGDILLTRNGKSNSKETKITFND